MKRQRINHRANQDPPMISFHLIPISSAHATISLFTRLRDKHLLYFYSELLHNVAMLFAMQEPLRFAVDLGGVRLMLFWNKNKWDNLHIFLWREI